MFSVRHCSAVINSRFCLTRPAFRPRACRRLLVNSISEKRPSSCRGTILRTRVGCASELLREVFGEAGAHARTSHGGAEIPFGSCVEIEMIVEVSHSDSECQV